jgi:hypothetical protein
MTLATRRALEKKNRRRGLLIAEGIGPLPYIAHHIEDTERTRATRECRYVGRRCGIVTSIYGRDIRCQESIAPRVLPAIGALGSVLPLPLIGKAAASPASIGLGVFN